MVSGFRMADYAGLHKAVCKGLIGAGVPSLCVEVLVGFGRWLGFKGLLHWSALWLRFWFRFVGFGSGLKVLFSAISEPIQNNGFSVGGSP